ncbi:MAG: MarR family transcriptional regulator [Pseudomonadota bacterium]
MDIAKDLVIRFYRLMNKLNELEKSAYDFGVEEKLYPSEIHTIEAIGNNSGINVTELAKNLCITKGAVSQMIGKLHKRGFINRVRSMDNDKEVLLILTDKGKKAFEGHERFHNGMYTDFAGLLKTIPNEQIDFLKTVLEAAESYIEQYRK